MFKSFVWFKLFNDEIRYNTPALIIFGFMFIYFTNSLGQDINKIHYPIKVSSYTTIDSVQEKFNNVLLTPEDTVYIRKGRAKEFSGSTSCSNAYSYTSSDNLPSFVERNTLEVIVRGSNVTARFTLLAKDDAVLGTYSAEIVYRIFNNTGTQCAFINISFVFEITEINSVWTLYSDATFANEKMIMGPNGNIYYRKIPDGVWAINPDGSNNRLIFPFDKSLTDITIGNGSIYVSPYLANDSLNSQLFAIDLNGNLTWVFQAEV